MFTSCEREEDISGSGSQTELILPTGPPVTVNFTVSIGGEEEKEASPSPSEGGEMEKTTTRSAVTPSSAAFVMPPKDEDSPDFANALYFSPLSGEIEGVFSPLSGEIEGALEGALYISSTIEENAPSITIRAMPLDPDIKVRVLAYSMASAPNDTLYGYADYEVDAGHNLVPYGTAPLTVPSGGNVLFVAYSFNADTLPPHAATISNIGCYDLIYVADNVLVSSSNMTIHLTLEHLFSKINLVADAQLNFGNSIDTIYGARYNHTFPDLSVHTGILTPAGSVGQIPFISNAPGSTGNPWKSKEQYVYLPPPSPPSIVVTIDSVKIDTDTYKNSPTPPWTIDYGVPLDPGKEYTLNVYFSKGLPDFRLYYSEGNATYGSSTPYVPANAIAGPASTSTNVTIHLTSPIGDPTVRFFSTYNATTTAAFNQVWAISQAQTSAGATAILTNNSASPGSPYPVYGGTSIGGIRLEIPAGYEGVITLSCGGVYTITVNVATRGITTAAKVGETFTAGGVEWRLLAKNSDGSNALVIAETNQFNCRIHDVNTNWDTDIRWDGSRLRNILNGISITSPNADETMGINWYNARMSDAAFAAAINPAAIKTKIGRDGPTYNTSLTAEKFFLLSEDEIFNTGSGSNIANNLFAGESLMADAHTRKGALSMEYYWWGRSPRGTSVQYATLVQCWAGTVNAQVVTNSYGVRPAVCLNLDPPPPQPCTQLINVSITPSNPGTVPTGSTVTLTASPSPSGATNVTYKWQRSFDGGITWYDIIGADTNILPATAVIVGVTTYKVIASNACSTEVFSTVNITGSETEPEPTAIANAYVGAFWKNNQTGERLIRIPRPATGASDGAWTARVVTGNTWIVLDNQASADGNVWTSGGPNISGNDAGFESGSTYKVTGNATTVSGVMNAGTPQIYFRIGLTSPNPGSTPRYGTVLLTYANHNFSQRIWIRQGDDADNISGTSPHSDVKWSPYNVGLYDTPGYYGNGVLVDYPTKAGYFYQWGSSTTGFHPTIPAGAIGSSYPYPTGTLPNICPSGYAVPTGGLSGLSQIESLTTTLAANGMGGFPADIKMVSGYYADGYFDRRQLVASISSTGTELANAAVSAGDDQVAYRGTLFYNPTSEKSLFLPSSGFRSPLFNTIPTTIDGALIFPGRNTYMWSSTSSGTSGTITYAYSIETSAGWGQSRILINSDGRTSGNRYGFTVRCVVHTCDVPLTGVSIDGTGPSTVPIGQTSPISVNSITPSNATTPITYQWQRSVDGMSTWHNVPGEIASSINAVAVVEDVTAYRVVATNCGGSRTSNVFMLKGTGPEPYNEDMRVYVGAFWRGNQTGERLIHMDRPSNGAFDGAWKATVIYGDFIELDKVMTSDPNVGWLSGANEDNVADMNIPANDATYRIPTGTGVSSVDGVMDASTPQIYFRIGLKSTNGPNRYGVVLLTYNNHSKSQRIFVRQGESADRTPGLPATQTAWSPYNLGNVNTPGAYLYATNDSLVAYPSQGGWLYQWGQNTTPVPLHPINPVFSYPGWVTGGNAYNLSGICPSSLSYSLPSGGSTSNNDISRLIDNTESVWGFYADGYFDRRKLCGAIGGGSTSGTSVAVNIANYADPKNQFVAYAGVLLYNNSIDPNKSLFFPSAGLRLGNNNGNLNNPGNFAGYWSDTGDAANTAWYWYVGVAGDVQQKNSTSRDYGMSIRCRRYIITL